MYTEIWHRELSLTSVLFAYECAKQTAGLEWLIHRSAQSYSMQENRSLVDTHITCGCVGVLGVNLINSCLHTHKARSDINTVHICAGVNIQYTHKCVITQLGQTFCTQMCEAWTYCTTLYTQHKLYTCTCPLIIHL